MERKTIEDLLRTPEKFLNWLEQRQDLEGIHFPVGQGLKPCQCPLANYLRDRGVYGAMVGPNTVIVYPDGWEDNIEVRTPTWVGNFVRGVDREFDKSTGEVYVSVAIDCLKKAIQ